jgi:hypothetical protein
MFTFWLGRSLSQCFILLFHLVFYWKVLISIFYSASVDGRIFIWKINEGSDEEEKPQITGKIVLAIQIEGEGKSVHPRVCWHPHKQVIMNCYLFCQIIYPLLCYYVFFKNNCAFLPYFPPLLFAFIVDQQELLYRKF